MNEEKCCPDLSFLIVFPSYRAGGVMGTGHAAAVVVNGRTGEVRGYDFGPDDHVHKQSLGYVRKLNLSLTLNESCLPECAALADIMNECSNSFGVNKRQDVFSSGNIQGFLQFKAAVSYEKSIAHAEDKARINDEYEKIIRGEDIPENERLSKEYHYALKGNNCMTFALKMLGQNVFPIDWPSDNIKFYQWLMKTFGFGINFSYNIKRGILECSGCCFTYQEREPTPEEMGSIPLGGGFYYDPYPGEF